MAATSFLGALGAKYPNSKVLFADDFNEGFCGWTELYESSTNVPRPALSRVTFPAMSGGYALRVGTGNIAGSTGKDGVAYAIKRLTRPKDACVIHFDGWLSWGATNAITSPLELGVFLDTQNRAGTLRANPYWMWQIRDRATGNQLMQWGVRPDAGGQTMIPNATYQHPFNENKQNYFYFHAQFDLTTGYKKLQIYDDVYDLTGLGAGTGNTTTVANFSGGLNFMVSVTNRNASFAQAWVDMDQVSGWYE